MKTWNLNEIRKEFLDFFEEHGHTRLKSYSLVPQNDPSLFLINAGMAPLKPYFMGEKKMANNRATSSQRCVRTQDIEQVGKTHRHATFFEMLGNFSFGDYFKREAIHWAWTFLTERLGMDPSRFWISVYEDDDEAYEIWVKEIGIPVDRMLRLGKEDNFWELDQGPCGPCSEIHYDRGPAFGEGASPLDNSDRFMEIWNLVFTQFNKTPDGAYEPLAHPNIDTGMGLERITLVLEEAANIFELSSFAPIREAIERLSGKTYGSSPMVDESVRVIMDHAKALTFLVYDGVVPSNEGRGYVLRRLLRRAFRHGKRLGISGEFLNQIVDAVITCYAPEYPELEEARARIHHVVAREEENFQQTIDQGLQLLEEIIASLKEQNLTTLSGAEAFKLYDTYGFPVDLTMEILDEQGLSVDTEGFSSAMEQQRQQSRAHRKGGAGWKDAEALTLDDVAATRFLGYETLEAEGKILALFHERQRVRRLSEGQDGLVVLTQTPFYAESGGQVGDHGTLAGSNGSARVVDVQKEAKKIFLHHVHVEEGALEVEETVQAAVDRQRRNDIRRNHSGTHLLHRALKMVLGDHVQQAGSLVQADHFRFDFTHFEAMTPEQIAKTEAIVNEAIAAAYPAKVEVCSFDDAMKSGAIGLFEDKYEKEVRVVSMGDFSKELCGGTHVGNTAEVLMLRILSEQGVSSGVRRIEAITGRACYRRLVSVEQRLDGIAQSLKVNRAQIEDRLDALREETRELRRTLDSLATKAAGDRSAQLLEKAVLVDGVSVVAASVEGASMEALKETVDQLKASLDRYCIVLASAQGGKVLLVSAVAPSLHAQGLQAGALVKAVAQATGGNGGGRPDFATAGGKDPSKVPEALAMVQNWVKEHYHE